MKDKKVLIILIIVAMVILFQKLDLDLAFKNILQQGQVAGVNQETDKHSSRLIHNELKIVFLDVDQGDAIFIETPSQKQILIDGGEGDVILKKLNLYIDSQDREINLIILTHPHSDHLSGLFEVLKNYQVDEIWLTGVIHTSNLYLEFLNLIKEKNIPTKNIFACGLVKLSGCSDKIIFEKNVEFKVLAPLENLAQQKIDNLNNSSIVLKLNYFNSSILLTGDAELKTEVKILANFIVTDLKADILKVGHHGSSDASGQDFLTIIHPEYAIISVGKNNPFGHPSLRTIRKLERLGAKILRTDQDGDIEFVINQDKLQLK